MRHKQLHESNGQRTHAVVLETGEEVMECLQKFAVAAGIHSAQLTAIGAFSEVTLLYFDWARKEYLRIPVREQVEVASLIGDIAEAPSGGPAPAAFGSLLGVDRAPEAAAHPPRGAPLRRAAGRGACAAACRSARTSHGVFVR